MLTEGITIALIGAAATVLGAWLKSRPNSTAAQALAQPQQTTSTPLLTPAQVTVRPDPTHLKQDQPPPKSSPPASNETMLQSPNQSIVEQREEGWMTTDAPQATVAEFAYCSQGGPPTFDVDGFVVDPNVKHHPQGGMSEIYFCWNPDTGEKGVLKRLKPNHPYIEDDRERLVREREALFCFETHGLTGVPRLICTGQFENVEGKPMFLLMERFEGETLHEWLLKKWRKKSYEAPSPEHLLHILLEISKIIAQVHGLGTTHRDLGPDQIIILRGRFFAIIDWGGVAKKNGLTTLPPPSKPLFRPPDVYEKHEKNKPHDELTDIYALGIIFYIIATGHYPLGVDYPYRSQKKYPGKNYREALGIGIENYRGELGRRLPEAKRPPTHEAYPKGLWGLLREMMNESREHRPPSVLHVMERLTRMFTGTSLVQRYHQQTQQLIHTQQKVQQELILARQEHAETTQALEQERQARQQLFTKYQVLEQAHQTSQESQVIEQKRLQKEKALVQTLQSEKAELLRCFEQQGQELSRLRTIKQEEQKRHLEAEERIESATSIHHPVPDIKNTAITVSSPASTSSPPSSPTLHPEPEAPPSREKSSKLDYLALIATPATVENEPQKSSLFDQKTSFSPDPMGPGAQSTDRKKLLCLAQIAQEPENDELRLHYASLLDLENNRLGEFIRIQCLVSQNPSWHSQSSARGLLKAHGKKWLKEIFPAWGGQVRTKKEFYFWDRMSLELSHGTFSELEIRFSRGWPIHLKCRIRDLKGKPIQKLLISPHLDHMRELTIYVEKMKRSSFVSSFCKNEQLAKELRILASSPKLQNLTTLDLSGNSIGDEGAKALASSPKLQNLTTLNLSGNSIGDEGAEALAKSPHFANLTTLNLSYNSIKTDGIQSLANSPHLTSLKILSLGSNNYFDSQIGGELAEALASSPKLQNLTTLDLSGNSIGDEGAKALASSPKLQNLTTLNLYNNSIGDEGAEALAKSPHFANLTTLNLSYNSIDNPGTKALASSPKLQNLTTLNLSGNSIGDEGAKALASSPKLQNLTTLNLYNNSIGDEGAEALAKSPHLTSLETLSLGSNKIETERAKALRKPNQIFHT